MKVLTLFVMGWLMK